MKRFFKANWTYILAGVGIILLYFIRIYHLTLLPVFADEAIYVRWSQVMANEPTLRFLPQSDGKEPLYMWVLMFVIKRFSDPLFIGRMVSVISGFGTLIGVWVLVYILFKNKLAATLGSLMYALSPITFFFDRMALVDSMLTMFGVWSFIFAYLTAKTKRLDLAMITGFSLGFAWLTKSTATVFMALLITFFIFVNNRKDFVKLLTLYVVSSVIAFAMFNILRLGPNFNLIASRNQDYVYPLNHIFVSPFDPLKGHMGGIINYFYLMGPVGLVVMWLLGYFLNYKKHWRDLLVLSAWAVGPIFLTAEYFKVVTARYIVYTIPFFIIIASTVFLANKSFVKISLLILILFLGQAIFFDYQLITNVNAAPLPNGERSGYLLEWTAGQGIKEISDILKTEHAKAPQTKIVVGTEGYFGTLPDGLQMYMQGTDNVIVIGVGLGFDRIPDPLAASLAAGNKTYLVVNKSRLFIKDNPNLKLLATFKKPVRRPESTEYAAFGPQDALMLFEVK